MWDLPGPGLEPIYTALAGRFLTTAPPGKSQDSGFIPNCKAQGRCWEDGKKTVPVVMNALEMLREGL